MDSPIVPTRTFRDHARSAVTPPGTITARGVLFDWAGPRQPSGQRMDRSGDKLRGFWHVAAEFPLALVLIVTVAAIAKYGL